MQDVDDDDGDANLEETKEDEPEFESEVRDVKPDINVGALAERNRFNSTCLAWQKADGKNAKKEEEGTGAAPGEPVPAAEKVTTNYMTKYERARVLGTRALQIR